MSNDLKGSDHILRLPSAPVYMSIMKTLEGKPFGVPIWSTFVHRDGMTLENENITGTLISLSKNIGDLSQGDKDGKVVMLKVDDKTYNIFLPNPKAIMQISFVVVFEESDTILVEDKHREELIRKVVEKLRKLNIFQTHINENDYPIVPDNPLFRQLQKLMTDVIYKYDQKRVKYLLKKEEKERQRLTELAKKDNFE